MIFIFFFFSIVSMYNTWLLLCIHCTCLKSSINYLKPCNYLFYIILKNKWIQFKKILKHNVIVVKFGTIWYIYVYYGWELLEIFSQKISKHTIGNDISVLLSVRWNLFWNNNLSIGQFLVNTPRLRVRLTDP